MAPGRSRTLATGWARLVAHRADLASLAWYLALTTVDLWPLITRLDSAVPHLIRDPALQATTLWDVSGHLLQGDLAHLYEASFFYGAHDALAFSDAQVGLQPVALPLRLLTNDALFTLNLLVVLTFPLTAVIADALGRLVTGGSKAAGLVAGTIFAFAAYRFTHIVHLNLLSSWTIPLSFLCLELFLRHGSWRSGLAWALSVILAVSMALHYFLFLALLEPLYLATRLAVSPERMAILRRLPRLILPAGLAAAGSFVLLLPYLGLRAEGYTRSFAVTSAFVARIKDYLAPAADSMLMHPLFKALRIATGPDEREIGPGILALLLAGGGIVVATLQRRREWLRTATPWLVVGVAAGILSLGPALYPNRVTPPPIQTLPALPYAALAGFLPLDSLRAPARFAVVVLLAVAMLAALTVAAIARSERLPRLARRAILGAIPILLALEYSVAIPVAPVAWGANLPPGYAWLRTAPPGPVVEIPTDVVPATRYALYSTVDGHPRLNGWSGFYPKGTPPVDPRFVAPDRFETWLADCRSLGARYLVVHERETDPALLPVIARARAMGELRRLVAFGGDVVYQVPP